MRPTATYVARSVVCVLGSRANCVKTAELIEMSFGAQTRVPKETCVRWGPRSSHGTGYFLGGYVPAHCNVHSILLAWRRK